jgi:hypothetical protein
MHHATSFNANPRFQVAGICDIDQGRLDAAAAKLGNPRKGTDAAALAREVRPDVFCFCTMPHLRTPFIKAAVEAGAKLVAFEKPVSLTSAELFGIRGQSGGQSPASLRSALPEGERDCRQWSAGPSAHGLRFRHGLDDPHAFAPDRLHLLV